MADEAQAATGLEFAATADLLEELMRRSRVAFIVMRPLTPEGYSWIQRWGVHGGQTDQPEAAARVLGLIELGKAMLLRAEPKDGPPPGPDAEPVEGDDGDDEGANNGA